MEEDGEQQGEVAMVVFQGEPLPLATDFEKMGGRLEAESGEAPHTGYKFDSGDGKGRTIEGKIGAFAAGLSRSKLGFRAVMEAEKSAEEDEAAATDMEVVTMADDSRTNGEGEGGIPIEKDPNLDVEDEDLMRRPNLGFDGANLNENHGERLKSSFNMAQFLHLAHKVIDKNDHESTAAFEELRLKWELRFGKVAMLRCFPPEKMMPRTTDFPPARARRQAYRSLLPANTMGKTTENDGSDGLMMAETSQPAKIVAGNILRRSETVQTRFSTVLPARDVDSEVALGSGDVDDDVEPNSAADLAQRLDENSADISIARADVSNDSDDSRAYVSSDAAADVISDAATDVIKDCNMAKEKSFVAPIQTGLYVGNIPLNAYPEPIIDDKIAHAFNHSSRKTLKFIAPTLKNGEVIVRPTLDTIRNGSKRWKTTAVGYFLGKRPYFHHLKEYALSVWLGLREFKSVADMEDIIEGGQWLFQGQPIVLQKWEPGMVPVWIKLRHLPVELWTEEGLSIVASGVVKPLYPDAITRACTRLYFARVCIMLDVNSKMPNHVIIMTPDEEGGELPCKIDVEYEWLPPRCTSCMTLGHSAKECTVNKPKSIMPPVNVYVPKVGALRELWASLESLAAQCINKFRLVGGDFNAIRDLSEVCGTSGDIRVAMEEFNTCLQNTALLPLPMQGEWYTWHNRSASPRNLWKRLDRMLTNDTWTLRFPSVFYQCLTPRTSDHSLMVVNGDNQQRFGGMFRFDNFLTLSPDFIHSVQSIWQQQIVGVPMFSVTRKLKALKPIFREQRRNKGDLSHNVELARGFLEQTQVLVSSHRQDELILLLEHCSRLVYAKAAKLERIMLQQRAKMEWMKGGDQCSRVFFRKIAQRRTATRILQINDSQGITITEPNAVIHEFISYYQSLLGGDMRQRVMDLRFLRPWARYIITTEEAGHLLEPFSAEDIKKAVFDIGEDRAPGPDGYSSGFYKNAWPMVGQEITKAVLDFYSTEKLLKQINSTILMVIPSPCQAAFVPGRSIGDNVMLAQELFTGYNQARLPPRCALKVDIRKAYDTVEWDFLLSVLQLFGFLEIFSRWVEECISSPSFSVGMNGKPHGYFAGARGLRQGDPLSPYLFVLLMEVLHMGILQLIEQDMNFAFHWKCNDLRIFQLGFADDLLLFWRANTESDRSSNPD
ncbi:UNVERIFIED_CONTAM: hypothetical protein Sindi_1670900 [Sesamum indicum]